MFCSHCGKQLSDEAYMCPDCGTPTANQKLPVEMQQTKQNHSGAIPKGLAASAFTLSTFAFVTGIVFGALFFVSRYSTLLLYILGASTILPAITGLAVSIYTLITATDNNDKISKPFAIISIVLSAFVLLFLFISGCILVA